MKYMLNVPVDLSNHLRESYLNRAVDQAESVTTFNHLDRNMMSFRDINNSTVKLTDAGGEKKHVSG